MEEKRNHIRSKRRIVIPLVIIAIIGLAAAFAVFLINRNKVDVAASTKPPVGAAVPSQFSFTGASGWWQGATNKTSMALFHDSHDCFTSVEHKTGIVDVAAELQKSQDSLTKDGYVVTSIGVQALTIQTAAGPQQYELHQSSVVTPGGATKLEGGQEVGYLQLSGGYLFIQGNCDAPDQLPPTISALQAIKFDESK